MCWLFVVLSLSLCKFASSRKVFGARLTLALASQWPLYTVLLPTEQASGNLLPSQTCTNSPPCRLLSIPRPVANHLLLLPLNPQRRLHLRPDHSQRIGGLLRTHEHAHPDVCGIDCSSLGDVSDLQSSRTRSIDADGRWTGSEPPTQQGQSSLLFCTASSAVAT